MIGNFTRDEFVDILHKNVSPTSPIQSQEHLYGRKRQLEQVEQALCAPGRSVFIYGDRGVGKTSLAQTIAYSQQSAGRNPIILACEPQTTVSDILTSALAELRKIDSDSYTTTQNINIGFKGFGVGAERTRQPGVVPQLQAASDLNNVMRAVLAVCKERYDESTVVVVDEFDRISSDEERSHSADFIKQIGDQKVSIKFVFCGVAESMQKLLGAHGSCYRYIDGVELQTLNWAARYEIIDNVSRALGVRVDDRPRFRIAAISDGFPHYIHRMCEQLFWQMFRDPHPCETPNLDHYREAVVSSVLNIEQHLKQTYDQAVMKEAYGYEQVLWAVADHSDLTRNTESIYDSYCHLMKSAGIEQLLDRQTVVTRLNALKSARCAQILTTEKKGWYRFRENIIRGYVRLRAEEQGCELAVDYAAASSSNAERTFKPRAPKKGRFGTRPQDKQKLEHPDRL